MEQQFGAVVSVLEQNRIFHNMFDLIRLFDAKKGLLYECDRTVRPGNPRYAAPLYSVWPSDTKTAPPCARTIPAKPCQARIRRWSDAADFLHPFALDGHLLVTELVTDISKYMEVAIWDEHARMKFQTSLTT